MFDDLMGQMQDAQKHMEEAKERMNNVFVDEQVEGGLVKVRISANKVVKELTIDQSLVDDKDKEAIEDLVLLAINRAIAKAESVHEHEMQQVAAKSMGSIPGLG